MIERTIVHSVAAVGDVADVRCWSGIPFHFLEACRANGMTVEPWRLDLARFVRYRWAWNALTLLRGQIGGFQYSELFLALAEQQIPDELWRSQIVTFNQHFPRASTVDRRGGSLRHYLDAPFVALATKRGLDLHLPKKIIARACALERDNYHSSRSIVTMARWASDVIQHECDVPANKLQVVLPGANLSLPHDYSFPTPSGRPGIERDFVLGFVGKDWERKGLPLLCKVRSALASRGWKVQVLAAGEAPAELQRTGGVTFVGFVDKRNKPHAFLEFLSSCDVGCLFSKREALGISTLEFLRAGVPVAGFEHEGPADTIPPDAGFRFQLNTSADLIADRLDQYLKDEVEQQRFRSNARKWSTFVTWERCVSELIELWDTGAVRAPVRPWLGLANQDSAEGLQHNGE